jgi:DNA polymerase III subunit chi
VTEVLFYHLQQTGVEQVLPSLLERSLERGWKANVRVGNEPQLEPLCAALWTYRDDSFLPHGTSEDGPLEQQPITLGCDQKNLNGAEVLFLVEGAVPEEIDGYQRCVLMFNGRDDEALDAARGHWKTLVTSEHDITYWQQNEAGGWEKKA